MAPAASGRARRITKQSFDLFDEDPREGRDCVGPVRPQLPFDVRQNGMLSDRPILEPAFEVLAPWVAFASELR